MSLAAIRDQAVPVRLVQTMLRRGRLPNGLLFWGPAGVGKRLTAMALAQAINCSERPDAGCGECLGCRRVARGNHPDVRVVTPFRKARVIDVEAIETVNELAALRPYESSWRVFIIDDADRMNPTAQNHFLKTLEEPPGQSLFILVTEHPRILLPTIRSRCQLVRFGGLAPDTVAELLRTQRDLPEDMAQAIAAISQGQISRALDLVDSEKRDIALTVVEKLQSGAEPMDVAQDFVQHLETQRKQIEAQYIGDNDDAAEPAASAEDKKARQDRQKAVADTMVRRDIVEYLHILQTWYRDVLVLNATGMENQVLNRDRLAALESAQAEGAADKLEAIDRARLYLDRFISEERVFRDLFFTLAAK